MVSLPAETETASGELANEFLTGLTEAASLGLDINDPPAVPAAPATPATPTATAAAPAVAPVPAPTATPTPVAEPPVPPTPEAAVPPTPTNEVELPEVLRQVQELNTLIAKGEPDTAVQIMETLYQVNRPLADAIYANVREFLTAEGRLPTTQSPSALPELKFDFASLQADDYDEQTWDYLSNANADREALTSALGYWQQQAIEAKQKLQELEQQSVASQQKQSSLSFTEARAANIQNALAAIPGLKDDPDALALVHNSVLAELQGMPEFQNGFRDSKNGNQLGAYQNGVAVDDAVNAFIARVAPKILPPTAPSANPPPVPPPINAPPAPPVMRTSIAPPAPNAGDNLVDGLLADISMLEQTNAAPWLVPGAI